jgi:uncharacterized protein YciI
MSSERGLPGARRSASLRPHTIPRMKALPVLLVAGLSFAAPALRAADLPEKKQPPVPPGMRVYYVGLLKKGPKWNPAEEADQAKFLGDHVAYLAKLEKDGRVAVAGSFLGPSNLRGMVIYKTRSLTEARAIVKDDPGVQSGRLLVDVYPWMSADGLRVVTPAAPPRLPGKGAPKKAPSEKSGEGKPAPPASAEPKEKAVEKK